jgi:SPP1 family predicted phage head-tail adaptor
MPLKRLSSSPNSIGGMSRQVTLNAPGGRNAADGGPQPPSPVITTWANIRALKGDELDKASQIAQEAEHVIRIPYQLGVNEDMTVGFESRTFQIKYIEDQDELHWFLDLYCAEIGQNAGGTAGGGR